jgi:uncharacterized SAM-binding protein YcdF (DUF218 family)
MLWLNALGEALVRADGPAKADMAVVLAGDQWCERILKGGELVRQGYVPAVLVSGPPVYGVPESDLTIGFAVRHGDPPQWFLPFPNDALSTRAEAAAILSELRRRNVHRFLLVTSDYHTGRAGRIYRSLIRKTGGGLEMRVVSAPDKYFSPTGWWKNREGQKVCFIEWTKTLANAAGL